MAIHYFDGYSRVRNSRNFGDDINPFLLGELFHRSIIDSQRVCVVGIGSILNDRNFESVDHWERKVVFSSGAGYGSLEKTLDDSYEFACVRGPKTAQLLGLPTDRGIADGVILMADYYPPKPTSQREGTVFVPHVNSGMVSGKTFSRVCSDLGFVYLSPDAPAEEFITTIQNAALVITEAMHGAILADTMRTPWLPFHYMYHNEFKWRDWFQSMALDYASHGLGPSVRDVDGTFVQELIRIPFHRVRTALFRKRLVRLIDRNQPFLSSDEVNTARKQALREVAARINDTYAT